MFICRRLLPCEPFPSIIRLSQGVRFGSSRSCFGRGHIKLISTAAPYPRPKAPSISVSVSTKHLLSRLLHPQKDLVDPEWTRDERKYGHEIPETTVYEVLRLRKRSLLAQVPHETFIRLASRAFRKKNYELASNIAIDATEIYTGPDLPRIVAAFFKMAKDSVLHLRKDALAPLLLEYVTQPDFQGFPSHILEALVPRFLEKPLSAMDQKVLKLIAKFYREEIALTRPPLDATYISYTPPEVIKTSYRFIHDLLSVDDTQHSFVLFHTLLESRALPTESQGSDVSSKDFKYIIRSTLVKASLHWNWRKLACDIMLDMLQSDPKPDPLIVPLTWEVSHALLDDPSLEDIAACGAILRALPTHYPETEISSALVQQFYRAAFDAKAGGAAQQFYEFSRSPEVVEHHQYPAPSGKSLTWLQHHIVNRSRHAHLGRILAAEVVEKELPIFISDRARFISLGASSGYSITTRQLWERYAAAPDAIAVVGNATLFVRMTSLYTGICHRLQQKLDQLPISYTDATPDEDAVSEEVLEYRAAKEQLADTKAFMEQFFARFLAIYEPLDGAPHFALTSLARAYIIRGDFAKGFHAFKLLIDRKVVPDMHDINVALSAMAEHSPSTAAKMIERMVEKGLQPTAVTFATVIRYAFQRKEDALAKDLIRRSRDFGDGMLTPKFVVDLIRSSLAHDDDESARASLQPNLERSIDILQSLPDHLAILARAPGLGKYCIFAALRADQPVIAFKFWSMLVKDKTDWDDDEQSFQRHLIAKMIRTHSRQKWLDEHRAQLMLSKLRPPVEPLVTVPPQEPSE